MSSFDLNQPENRCTLDLLHDSTLTSSSASSSCSSSCNPEKKVFACKYCRRKFHSSQALGGHQNAHKLERTLAKQSRYLTPRAGSGSGGHVGWVQPPLMQVERRDMGYCNKGETVEEDFHLDLSLRL